jgi:hypothetical protein
MAAFPYGEGWQTPSHLALGSDFALSIRQFHRDMMDMIEQHGHDIADLSLSTVS